MSQPFSGMPDPEARPPIRRRMQPGVVGQSLREAFRTSRRYTQGLWQRATRHSPELWRRGKRYSHDLWLRGSRHSHDLWLRGIRNPRTLALIGGAVALTVVGAYTLSASGAGRSLCPAAGESKKPTQFALLMDPVLPTAAGSELDIHYDVCGLPSGTAYLGRVRLSQQRASGKKVSATAKPLMVSFKDQVDGPATRRQQQLDLASARPGAYTLELSVIDNRGRQRKKIQKVVIKAR